MPAPHARSLHGGCSRCGRCGWCVARVCGGPNEPALVDAAPAQWRRQALHAARRSCGGCSVQRGRAPLRAPGVCPAPRAAGSRGRLVCNVVLERLAWPAGRFTRRAAGKATTGGATARPVTCGPWWRGSRRTPRSPGTRRGCRRTSRCRQAPRGATSSD